jgi:cathepsin X
VSTGTYWGELGFFKIQRGENFMMLEACDCWYGNPTWDMETAVEEGNLGGSMGGTVEVKVQVTSRQRKGAKQERTTAGHVERARAMLRQAGA